MPNRIFYIYDPMCSWCYAFGKSWSALQENMPNDIRIVYLLGGLAPDTTAPMSISMQKNIQQAWRRIEETVPGVQFNWSFWSSNTPIRSTFAACRAILAARKKNTEAETLMLEAIQRAYYQKAMNPSLLPTLHECAREIGLDVEEFKKDLVSQRIEQELQHEIQLARRMGVNSYPSLRLIYHHTTFPITVNYVDHQSMLDTINSLIEKSETNRVGVNT